MSIPAAPRRSRALAAVLGLIAPGVGQLYAGRLDRGLATFAAVMAVQGIGLGIAFVLPPTATAAATFSLVGTGLLVALCLFAAIDAARLAAAQPDTPPMPWYVLLIGALAVWSTNLAAEAAYMVARPHFPWRGLAVISPSLAPAAQAPGGTRFRAQGSSETGKSAA